MALKTIGYLRGPLVALLMLVAMPAWGQRVQFPSMVAQGPTTAYQAPLVQPPGGWDSYGDPAAQLAQPQQFAQPQFAQPQFAQPQPQFVQPQPQFVQPQPQFAQPPPTYSPYAPSPYAAPPTQPLYPDGVASPFPEGPYFGQMENPLKLLQEVRVRDTWVVGNGGSEDFDVNSVEISGTFTFPVVQQQPPVLITPGFATHWFEGPITMPAPNNQDLPPRVYDVYVDGAWHPQITPWLGANLGVRVGLYTDFEALNTDSFRIMGRALAVISFTPTLQIAAGVVYLDRNKIKLLPAGGIIWAPSDDARYEILFPNPKLARKYTTVGSTEVWFYLAAEYGGGSWTGQRILGDDSFDYNDIRVMLGMDLYGAQGWKGMFEAGYVFNREILFRSGNPQHFDPADTFMLRVGVSH